MVGHGIVHRVAPWFYLNVFGWQGPCDCSIGWHFSVFLSIQSSSSKEPKYTLSVLCRTTNSTRLNLLLPGPAAISTNVGLHRGNTAFGST